MMIVLLGQLLAATPTFASDDPFWDKANVAATIWEKTPDGSAYMSSPGVGPADPFEYKYELSCEAKESALLQVCLSALPACDQARGGTHVDWYRKLRDFPEISWSVLTHGACIYSEKPVNVLEQIAAQINSEFKKTPVKGATIASQPGPHTLRGNHNNFYAQATTQNFNITLLGQKVHITATPVSYTWNYGDGTTMGPTDLPGTPLPEDRIGEQTLTSHAYTTTGKYNITATTHFNGTYSVNNGPTLPIPDQGHINSNPITITVWRAITKNYADNCNTNPQGTGC